MDLHEIARRTIALPGQYADRVDPVTGEQLRDTAEAGETPELLDLLVAALRASGATITAAERDQLAALLAACHMPTTDLEQVPVTG